MGDNSGINKLSRALIGRMRQEGKSQPVADFGSIGKTLNLMTDSMQIPLSPDEYSVLANVGVLNPGDRVLVIWVSNEKDIGEPVIAGKIV